VRITRAIAARLGLDYAALLAQARATGRRVAPSVVLPGEPVLGQVERGPGWWSVQVVDWRPATLNELMSGRRTCMRLKKRDRLVLCAMFEQAVEVPPATGKRRVSLRIVLPRGQRRFDKDAFWKSLLDGLTHAGALVDDRPDYCEPGTVEYARDERLETTIRLEDVSCLKKS
jgi:hypothetical protein